MTLSDTDAQMLILRTVGDIDPATGEQLEFGAPTIAGWVGQSIGLLWAKHADKEALFPGGQELYVTRDCYDMLIARLNPLVDIMMNRDSQKLSQRPDRLITQRDAIVKRIVFELERLDEEPAFDIAEQVYATNARERLVDEILRQQT